MADSDIVVNQEIPETIENSVQNENTQNSYMNLSNQNVSYSRIDSLENFMGSQISNLVKEMGHLSQTLENVTSNLQNKLGTVEKDLLHVRSRLSQLEHPDNEISFNRHKNSILIQRNPQIVDHITSSKGQTTLVITI